MMPNFGPVASRISRTVRRSSSGPSAGRYLYAGKPIAFTAAASAAYFSGGWYIPPEP